MATAATVAQSIRKLSTCYQRCSPVDVRKLGCRWLITGKMSYEYVKTKTAVVLSALQLIRHHRAVVSTAGRSTHTESDMMLNNKPGTGPGKRVQERLCYTRNHPTTNRTDSHKRSKAPVRSIGCVQLCLRAVLSKCRCSTCSPGVCS